MLTVTRMRCKQGRPQRRVRILHRRTWTPRFPEPRTAPLPLISLLLVLVYIAHRLTPMSRTLTCWQTHATSARCAGILSPAVCSPACNACTQAGSLPSSSI